MARRLSVALAVLAAAVVAVGCGEDNKETFRKDFRPLNEQLVAVGRDIGNSLATARTRTDRQLAADFQRHAARTRETVARLRGLDPPDEYKGDLDRLIAASDKIGKDLQAIADAAKGRDARAARTATVTLIRDGEKGRAARQALARKAGVAGG